MIGSVVGQLERDSEVPAIAFEREFGILARLRDDRRDPARCGEQRRGLGADDLQIVILVGIDLSLCGELLDLAFGDHCGSVAEDPQHFQAAVLDH
jgi:hypothetical protein